MIKETDPKPLTVIGRAELVDFPLQKITQVPARIDTGARTSSLWASDIKVTDGVLSFVFFGSESEFYTGEVFTVSDFSETVVSSSTGEQQRRFKTTLTLGLGGKRIKAMFTLADRSTQVYPVLVGRNTLKGKFIVNVKTGTVLKERETKRTTELRTLLDDTKGGEA